jgi:hypothetical protein
VRHRRRAAITNVEPQREVDQADEATLHCMRGFVRRLGIDLGQDFEAAPRRGKNADHLLCAQVMAVIGKDLPAVRSAERMRAGCGHQCLGLAHSEAAGRAAGNVA